MKIRLNIKLILLFSLLFNYLGSKVTAQKMTAGIDTSSFHPVYIKSADDRFLLNIGLTTQFRYNSNFRENVPDSLDQYTSGYNLARTQIFFEGNYTPRFYYHIRTNINSDSKMELFAAYLQWNINNKMWLRMGRQFMALGLEDWVYADNIASIEFSAQNFTYAIWSSFGFQYHHLVNDKLRYWVGFGNGAYGSRRSFPTPSPTDATVTGRVEYNILGTPWGQWDDMLGKKGSQFAMLAGFGTGRSFRYAEKNEGLDGSKGGTQYNFDYSIAGNGYRFFAHYTHTFLYFDEFENESLPSFYSTFGYWFGKHIFSYARFDYVGKGNLNENIASDNYVSPGLGVSYYPFTWSNKYRLTLEYNYLNAIIADTHVESDGQLGLAPSSFGRQHSIRFQFQFGF